MTLETLIIVIAVNICLVLWVENRRAVGMGCGRAFLGALGNTLFVLFVLLAAALVFALMNVHAKFAVWVWPAFVLWWVIGVDRRKTWNKGVELNAVRS